MSSLSCKKNNDESFPPADAVAALYVHVPFCRAKCRYCDFYSVTMDAALAGRFVHALHAELEARRTALRPPLDSLFLGGGTPSVLGPALLGEVLGMLSGLALRDTEWSVEVNPGTVDDALAGLLADGGVNRVSVGAQSFQPGELALLGRIHDTAQTRQTFALLRRRGLSNLGLDLMYGLPGQSLTTWTDTLRQALDLGPSHLSCYALSFEPGTPLEADLRAGRVRAMDDSLQRECYYAAIDQAAAAGLEHYEISNFALAGLRCRHNMTYWHNRSYLGLGPAAASYVAGVRQTNAADLADYLARVESARPAAATTEQLTGPALRAETAMLELRLREGIDRDTFRRRFGMDVTQAFPRTLARYAPLGALELTLDRLRLAQKYLFVADTILADLVDEGSTRVEC